MIFILGGDGQLGQEFRRLLPDANFLTRKELDLCDIEKVKDFLENNKISLLINAAAYTAVDKAESEQELARKINTTVPYLLSEYSLTKKFKLISYSSDYVFDGKSSIPYKEDTVTNPLNFYGRTKLESEVSILQINPKNLIIRTSWVYSNFGKNFVQTILEAGQSRENLNVVYDQVGTLTWAKDLAEISLLGKDLTGIFNYSNEGVSSWYDVACELKRQRKFSARITPILTSEFQSKTQRPHYSVLDKAKIKSALSIKIPHWTESLELCLKKQY